MANSTKPATRRVMAAFVAAVLVLPAIAQVAANGQDNDPQNPPPPGPRGGQGGFQGGPHGGPNGGPGMGRMPMGGLAGLLRNPDVKKELGVTDEQISKIESETRKVMEAMRNDGGQPQPGRQPGSHRDKVQAVLKSSLSEAQFKRFNEIELQVVGARALLRPDIREKLGLTEEQIEDIQDIVGPPQGGPGMMGGQGGPPRQGGPGQGGFGGPPPQGGPGQGGFGGPPPQGGPGQGGFGGQPPQGGPGMGRRTEMEKVNRRAFKVLTEKQLALWKQMTGKEFKMGPPPGQPGQGDPQGRPRSSGGGEQ